MEKDPFKEYIRLSEPNKRDKGYAWHTAIGLQAVDGLSPSQYLIDTAVKNIEGEITIDEAQELLNSYYEENPKNDSDDRTEEADKVSVRIAKLLSEKAFSFAPNEYISIHKKLFTGIYSHAGKVRDYNITKKEWVLDGATVLYGSASELRATLDYDFSEEKKFSYKGLDMDEIIHYLAVFVSRLWQIHIFGEGNTRTTAVFFIKYLRTLGFDEKNELHNRSMHISGKLTDFAKADIDMKKANIEKEKADIESKLVNIDDTIISKTKEYIVSIYEECSMSEFFGRSNVEHVTGLKSTRASELIKLMLDNEIIEPVKGHGKGKYRFT